MGKMTYIGKSVNPDAIWQLVKRECDAGNIKGVEVETFTDDIKSPEGFTVAKYVRTSILTLTFGSKTSWPNILMNAMKEEP